MNTSVNTLYSEYKGGQAFVYSHEALHLQNKPQKAGYEAETADWDTEPDSNASDEEDLKQ